VNDNAAAKYLAAVRPDEYQGRLTDKYSVQQLVRAFTAFLRDHPESDSLAAPFVLEKALSAHGMVRTVKRGQP
jgi:hypothetical protein